jgi:hypothetical protein
LILNFKELFLSNGNPSEVFVRDISIPVSPAVRLEPKSRHEIKTTERSKSKDDDDQQMWAERWPFFFVLFVLLSLRGADKVDLTAHRVKPKHEESENSTNDNQPQLTARSTISAASRHKQRQDRWRGEAFRSQPGMDTVIITSKKAKLGTRHKTRCFVVLTDSPGRNRGRGDE